MRIRDFAFSAAFMALLTTSTAIVTPAMAQKGRFLEPSTSWAVTRVGKNQGQGSEYCALARRFDENTIMTMARNANAETSFALDFQTPRLTVGQTVEVILDPGAGSQRAYSVQPVSEKAFVIRLGNDDAFFEALGRTGFLRVEVEDQQLSFNLQDIDQGRSQLETCIAASVMPAAGDSIFYDVNAPKPAAEITPPADMPSFTAAGSSSDIASLRAEIERLREKQAEITDLVSASEREVRNDRISSENADVIADLRERVSQLESEKESLETELSLAGQRKDMAISAQVSEETISRLESENDNLRKMVREFEVRLGEHSALLSEVEGLRKSNGDLRQALEGSKQIAEEERSSALGLQEVVASLEIQNAELSAQLETAKTGLMNFASQVSDIEDVRKANEALKQQLADAQERQKAFDEITARLQSIEAEKIALEQAAQAAEDKATMDLQLKHELEASIVALKTENDQLQKTLQQSSNSKEELEILTSKIDDLNKQNTNLQEQLKSADTQYQKSVEDHAALIAALETKIATLNEEKSVQDKQLVELSALTIELGTLRQKNEDLQTQLDEAQKTSETVSDLRTQVELLAAGNEELQAEIERVRSEKQGEYAAQIESLSAENEGLKARLELQESEISQIDSLKQELEGLRAEKISMMEELEVLELKDAKSSESFAALAQEKNDLIVSQQGLNTELESLRQEQKRILEDKESLSKEKNILQEENESLRKKIAETTLQEGDLITQLRSEKEALELSLAEEKKSFEALQANLKENTDQKTDQIESYKTRLEEKEQKLSDLASQIEQKQTEIETRAAEVAILQTEMEQMRKGHENVVAALESQLAEKQNALASLEIKLSESIAALEPAGNETQVGADGNADTDEPAANVYGPPVALAQDLPDQGPGQSNAQQLRDLVAENERLQTELKAVDQQRADLESALHQAQADNESLQQQIEMMGQAQNQSDDSAQDQAPLAALITEEELAALQTQLDDALEQNKALQAHILELEDIQKRTSSQAQPDVAAADAPDDYNASVPAAALNAYSDVAELNRLLESLTSENRQLKEQISGLEQQVKQIADLETALAAAQDENAALRAQIEEQSRELESLRQSNTVQASVSSADDAEALEAARLKIVSLEKKLSQADIEKQRAMENLAKSYMQLKNQMHDAGLQPISAEQPSYHDANASGVKPGRDRGFEVAVAQESSGIDPRAGGDIDIREEVLPMPGSDAKAPQNRLAEAPSEPDYSVAGSEPLPQEYSGSEAQMYEAREMRSLENRQEIVERASRAQAEKQNISVRQSQDPFAGMKTEDTDGNIISDPAIQDAGPDNSENATQSEEFVNWQQARQTSPQETSPQAQQAQANPRSDIEQKAVVASVSQGVYSPPFSVEDMLKRAEIAPASGIQMVEEASGQGRVAYQWQEGNVFGTAELSPLTSDTNFESAVQSYLERTQARCGGDFAVVPDDTRQMGDIRVDSYEIACVGASVQASASLLFFNQSGTFAILTHEADIEDMDSAMTMRDRIMKTLTATGAS